ncbi:MAG: xrtK [Chitinophagaceae bacterium]|nr:xrtK [Chitinophagaceae bacterium]
MKQNSKYIYYLCTMIIFMALKAWYTTTDHDQLLFILKPTQLLVEIFTGSPAVYDAAHGYFYPDLNITIEKSCSGFNFWLLSFALFVFVSLNHLRSQMGKLFAIPAALLLSYVLTLFVNASRIVTSIAANSYTQRFSDHPITWLHQAEGTFIYLLFLILFYSALQFFFTQHSIRHEKLA